MHEFIVLVLGLFGLWLGTELILRGALNVANYYKLSHVFIGLTILAIGTDLAELVVSITGAIHRLNGVETSGVIIGDAIGSSFGQIGLVLGLIGLISYVTLTKREIARDCLMLLGSCILLFLVGVDGQITRLEGGILILIYVIYYISLYREEKVHEKVKKKAKLDLVWDIVSLIAGLIIVVISSDFVIKSAVSLASIWDVSQSVIGILVVGLGTSLPELVVSVSAVMRGASGLSFGNLIGSNIFDLLFVIGIGGVISELVVGNKILFFDLPFLFLLSGIVLIFFVVRKGLQKKEAAILIGLYLIYVVMKVYGF